MTALDPLLEARGTPFACGRHYGAAASTRIRGALEAYRGLIRERAGLELPAAVAFAARYDECVGDLAPRSRDELQGVAAGARLPYATLLALNCRSELLFLGGGPPPSECSSFAMVPDCGDVLGGQNWDWNPQLAASTTIRGFACDDEPAAISVGEAGHLSKVGFNAAGLLVCTNTLVSLQDGDCIGLPYHVILRELLRFGSVGEAVAYLGSVPKAMAANYLLADRSGEAKDVEAVGGSGQEIAVLEIEGGTVCHTNHFLDERFKAIDARAAANPHTYSRLSALASGLSDCPTDVDALVRLLRDHAGFPNSLCSHPSDDVAPYDQRATLASVVVNISRSTVWIAVGTPCSSSYEAYEVATAGVQRAPELDECTVRSGASTTG